jgi:acyl carrier protein
MDEQTIFNRIVDIIAAEFPDNDEPITRNTTAEDVAGWDSIAHVGLMAAIEEAFGIRFSPVEIVSFEEVGGVVRSVAEKLAAAGGAAAAS